MTDPATPSGRDTAAIAPVKTWPMPYMRYKDFLKSEQWARMRNDAVRRAGYECEKCGQTQILSLQVHHLNWSRAGGHELPEDLEVVCNKCFKQAHPKRRKAVAK